MQGLRVVKGIPSTLTDEAARVLVEAFPLKMAHELRAHTPEQADRLVSASMRPDLGWLALDEEGAVVGVLGVGVRGRRFLNWSYSILARELGLLGAVPTRVFAACESVATRPGKGRWRVEVLAVAEAVRGCGVGTALLTSVIAAARAEGLRTLTLEVVDTNGRARSLYERLGFRCAFTLRTGSLTVSSGYRGIGFMRLDL